MNINKLLIQLALTLLSSVTAIALYLAILVSNLDDLNGSSSDVFVILFFTYGFILWGITFATVFATSKVAGIAAFITPKTTAVLGGIGFVLSIILFQIDPPTTPIEFGLIATSILGATGSSLALSLSLISRVLK